LYRDGGFYGNNRKLVEEVYFLAHKYLVVRCARILGNSPDSLLDRLLEYRPIPYTLDSYLQFVGLNDVLGLLSTCIDKLRIPTVVTAAGSGCVTVEELCATAQVTPVIADGAKKVIRDCDSSIADRMHPFKSSMDYAKDYIDRRKVQEAFIRG
jgi:hypothetical protein